MDSPSDTRVSTPRPALGPPDLAPSAPALDGGTALRPPCLPPLTATSGSAALPGRGEPGVRQGCAARQGGRQAVGDDSAGGNLAAGVTLLVRDQGEVEGVAALRKAGLKRGLGERAFVIAVKHVNLCP